jgi:hypothetical protein
MRGAEDVHERRIVGRRQRAHDATFALIARASQRGKQRRLQISIALQRQQVGCALFCIGSAEPQLRASSHPENAGSRRACADRFAFGIAAPVRPVPCSTARRCCRCQPPGFRVRRQGRAARG